ncbi:MAG: hypothetical protein DBX48_04335 [Limosilactobacillus fermentum]|nr:MAG: hypothetical protein DBX48_04335 [Limosilactobacillus fermentum]
MIPYHIISTGSKGNAVVINHSILIDCGVPFKDVVPFIQRLKLVLLTHIHSDHFRPSTLRRLSCERPLLRFACCRWLVADLVEAGVSARNIDILDPGVMYGYGICNVIPVRLVHNVPNCGYKIHFPTGKVFYATDTNNLSGITAKHYDLFMVEANYEDEVIRKKIQEKRAAGEYAYEVQAMQNHLSKAKCDDFIYRNIGPGSEYVYLHGHVDEDGAECEEN